MGKKETSVMNKKKIIILSACVVLLLAILGAVSLMDDKTAEEKTLSDTEKNTESQKYSEKGSMIKTNSDMITEMSFSISGENFTLKKTDDGWKCPQHDGIPLSESKITAAAVRLCSIMYIDKIDANDASYADFGITDGCDTVWFKSELGDTQIIKGTKSADSSMCYVKLNTDPSVYLIRSEIADSIFNAFETYRGDTLQRIDFDSITDIEIKNKNGKIKLWLDKPDRKNGIYNAWRMDKPISANARDDMVKSKIISVLSEMKISKCVSDSGDFENYGLDKKDVYAAVSDSKGKKETFYFGKTDGSVFYVSIDSLKSIYSVELSDEDIRELGAIDVSERYLSLNNRDIIKNAEVTGNGSKYIVDFSDDNAVKINGKETKDDSVIREVYEHLCGMLADGIYTGSHGSEEMSVLYNLKNGQQIKLSFASLDDRYYTVSKNGKTMFIVLKSKIKDMMDVLDKYIK